MAWRMRKSSYPERLLGEKVRMAAPRPQTARAETARGVLLGPREACTGPLRARVVRPGGPVFPCVERKLLVVSYEFERKERESSQG
jgi:hypothetical protein